MILRKTTFGDGQTYPDDWQVFWRGLPVGRILKQPGVPFGRPNWWWGVNFDQRAQPAHHKGICADIEECKRRFKVAWSGVQATILDLRQRGTAALQVAYREAITISQKIEGSP
jgi:hypothetical protein